MQEPVVLPRRFAVLLGLGLIASATAGLLSASFSSFASPWSSSARALTNLEAMRLTFLVYVPGTVVMMLYALVLLLAGLAVLTRRRGVGPLLVCLALAGVVMLLADHPSMSELAARLPWRSRLAIWHPSTPWMLPMFVGAVADSLWPPLVAWGLIRFGDWTSLRRPAAWVAPLLLVALIQGSLRLTQKLNERLRIDYARSQGVLLAAEPGTAHVVLVPAMGEAGSPPIDAAARVTLIGPRRSGSPLEHHVVETRVLGGAIDLPDVPTGEYDVELVVDANPDNGWMMGGDYYAGAFDQPLLLMLERNGETVRREFPTNVVLSLVEPAILRTATTDDERVTLRAPVTFAWSQSPGARAYRCRVTHRTTSGLPSVVAESTQTDARWVVDLPPTAAGEWYMLAVSATGPDGRVASLETTRGFEIAPEGRTVVTARDGAAAR